MQFRVLIDLVILGQEVADTAPQLGYNILLMDDLLLPVLKLRPRSLHSHQPLHLLLILHIVIVVGRADEGDIHPIGINEAGSALTDGSVVANGLDYFHFGHVVDIVLDPLLGWIFDS